MSKDLNNEDEDTDDGMPGLEGLAAMIASLSGNDMTFTHRVMLWALCKRHGYVGKDASCKFTQAEVEEAQQAVKHCIEAKGPNEKISGLVCRPLEVNGDGLEFALFEGKRNVMSKVADEWQSERPNGERKIIR